MLAPPTPGKLRPSHATSLCPPLGFLPSGPRDPLWSPPLSSRPGSPPPTRPLLDVRQAASYPPPHHPRPPQRDLPPHCLAPFPCRFPVDRRPPGSLAPCELASAPTRFAHPKRTLSEARAFPRVPKSLPALLSPLCPSSPSSARHQYPPSPTLALPPPPRPPSTALPLPPPPKLPGHLPPLSPASLYPLPRPAALPLRPPPTPPLLAALPSRSPFSLYTPYPSPLSAAPPLVLLRCSSSPRPSRLAHHLLHCLPLVPSCLPPSLPSASRSHPVALSLPPCPLTIIPFDLVFLPIVLRKG